MGSALAISTVINDHSCCGTEADAMTGDMEKKKKVRSKSSFVPQSDEESVDEVFIDDEESVDDINEASNKSQEI